MVIKKMKIWIKDLLCSPNISIKNVKDSKVSIKINGKEKIPKTK
jgi:hypothetical protein